MGGRGLLTTKLPMGKQVLAGLSKLTRLFPRVQSQVSFGQTPEALRGLIEMSLNLNVL